MPRSIQDLSLAAMEVVKECAITEGDWDDSLLDGFDRVELLDVITALAAQVWGGLVLESHHMGCSPDELWADIVVAMHHMPVDGAGLPTVPGWGRQN